MLTPEGIDLLWRLAAGSSDDTIPGWKLVVSDGSTEAEAPVSDPSIEGGAVTVAATFGADDANFEWARRQVISGQGVVVDSEDEDHGRKAPGSEWTLEATLELTPDADGQ